MADPTSENWQPIAGFKGYEISDLGRVRSYRKKGPGAKLSSEPKLLKLRDKKQSLRVLFWNDGRQVEPLVHRLVAEAFIGKQPPVSHQWLTGMEITKTTMYLISDGPLIGRTSWITSGTSKRSAALTAP